MTLRPLLAVLATVLAYPAAPWKRTHFDHHQDRDRLDVLFGSPPTTVPTILAILVPLGWLPGGGVAGAAAVCA